MFISLCAQYYYVNTSCYNITVLYIPPVPQGTGQHAAYKGKYHSQGSEGQDDASGCPGDNQDDGLWWFWNALCRRWQYAWMCMH